jgi:Co/Zn/Cd efflux system component
MSVKSETKASPLSPQQANEGGPAANVEPRWPVALAVFSVLLLFWLTPGRSRLLPSWSVFAIGIALILLMIGVSFGGNRPRWLRFERVAMLAAATVLLAMTFIVVAFLVLELVNQPTRYTGQQLLTAGIEAWVTNVLAFSILYWDVDRGGPENRVNPSETRPDWLFAQTGVPDEAPPGWRPTYVDYLFLAFSTATAFSATDVAPITDRAKLLMMLESCTSLATITIIASRALNILGG